MILRLLPLLLLLPTWAVAHPGPHLLGLSDVFYWQNADDVDCTSAPTYRLYEQETATPILTGSYALFDDGNTVGFYAETIALLPSNGFDIGKTYVMRATCAVSGVTRNIEESFSIVSDATTCDISAATSATSFTIATCISQTGQTITLADGMFEGRLLTTFQNGDVGCNIIGQSTYIQDQTAGVVTARTLVGVTDMPIFTATPNTSNCGVKIN
jgi:hypothetical protein